MKGELASENIFTQQDENLGPACVELLAGEAVAVESEVILCRRGRSGVRVRVFGDSSIGWAEAAEKWGASVEAVIMVSKPGYNEIVRLLTQATPITTQQAYRLFTPKRWHGILLASIHETHDASILAKLFHKWKPAVAILAFPGKLSRRQVLELAPSHEGFYKQLTLKPHHSNVGGVTATTWHVVHLSRISCGLQGPQSMTMTHYPRTLQTALDDTLGGDHVYQSFESPPSAEGGIVGMVSPYKISSLKPVYSADMLGPDLSLLKAADRFFWVKANSVRSRQPVVRLVTIHELHAMWDYEVKLECKHWSVGQKVKALSFRVLSPPGKMLRLFLDQASEAINTAYSRHNLHRVERPLSVGFTKDVLFSPMEA